jgi:hypothetical protein
MRARSFTFPKENKTNKSDILQAPIGCVTQPRKDKRNDLPVSAEVLHPCLGITTICLRCEALRDYFYVGSRQRPGGRQFGGPPCATWSGRRA